MNKGDLVYKYLPLNDDVLFGLERDFVKLAPIKHFADSFEGLFTIPNCSDKFGRPTKDCSRYGSCYLEPDTTIVDGPICDVHRCGGQFLGEALNKFNVGCFSSSGLNLPLFNWASGKYGLALEYTINSEENNWYEVTYDENVHSHLESKEIRAVAEWFLLRNTEFKGLAESALTRICTHKHAQFSYEKEVRYIKKTNISTTNMPEYVKSRSLGLTLKSVVMSNWLAFEALACSSGTKVFDLQLIKRVIKLLDIVNNRGLGLKSLVFKENEVSTYELNPRTLLDRTSGVVR